MILIDHFYYYLRGCGEIGKLAALRWLCLRAWGFNSPHPHLFIEVSPCWGCLSLRDIYRGYDRRDTTPLIRTKLFLIVSQTIRLSCKYLMDKYGSALTYLSSNAILIIYDKTTNFQTNS